MYRMEEDDFNMDDLREDKINFCRHYSDSRQLIPIYDPSQLFDTFLDEDTAISYQHGSKRYSMVLVPTIDKSRMVGKEWMRQEDELLNAQIVEDITINGYEICNGEITSNYLAEVINDADYKFIVTQELIRDNHFTCEVKAFRFLKKIKEHRYHLGKFKIIYSSLVCSYPIRKEVPTTESKLLIVNPSFGSYLTFQAVHFAKRIGYDFLMIRAADFYLIPLYIKWGFHFGLPYLNLDNLMKSIDWNNIIAHTDVLSTLFEDIAISHIKREVIKRLETSYNLAALLFSLTKKEWDVLVQQRGSFEEVAKELATYIAKGMFCMYFDLNNDKDLTTLANYSKNKIYSYFKN